EVPLCLSHRCTYERPCVAPAWPVGMCLVMSAAVAWPLAWWLGPCLVAWLWLAWLWLWLGLALAWLWLGLALAWLGFGLAWLCPCLAPRSLVRRMDMRDAEWVCPT